LNHPLFPRNNKHAASPQGAVASFIRAKKLTGSLKNKVTLVFDGYPPPDFSGSEENTDMIFSRRISADEKIKKIIEESANRKNIIVVSDDREISFMVKSLGARCIGIEEFIGAKEKRKAADKELLKPELSYSEMHKINQELRKIWLK